MEEKYLNRKRVIFTFQNMKKKKKFWNSEKELLSHWNCSYTVPKYVKVKKFYEIIYTTASWNYQNLSVEARIYNCVEAWLLLFNTVLRCSSFHCFQLVLLRNWMSNKEMRKNNVRLLKDSRFQLPFEIVDTCTNSLEL
jgi:hypothetical protein